MGKEYKQYYSRKEWMKGEFNFSDEEIEGLDKFIYGREGELVSEFLRSVIETKDLNNKQKVVISFMMGRFIQKNMSDKMKYIEKSITDGSHSEFNDLFGGQYGG